MPKNVLQVQEASTEKNKKIGEILLNKIFGNIYYLDAYALTQKQINHTAVVAAAVQYAKNGIFYFYF